MRKICRWNFISLIGLNLRPYTTRKRQRFKPISDMKVGLYTCGITAYYSTHIGNIKAYVEWDVLKRLLTYDGYDVTHVENITDVGHLVSNADTGEDKLRLEAEKERKSMKEIASFYTDIFIEDCRRLNIMPPSMMPRATDHSVHSTSFFGFQFWGP